MSVHLAFLACLCASTSNLAVQDDGRDVEPSLSREDIVASVENGFGHLIEYRRGDQHRMVTWANMFRGQNKCTVAIFEFDSKQQAWRRTYNSLVKETREISVEFTRESIRLRNDQGVIVYDDSREPKRFKGVELYSWKNEDDKWTFALLDGTNRLKTALEIRDAPDRTRGIEAIKNRLAELAVGETVIWNPHEIKGFELPPEQVRKEVSSAARKAGIQLD